MGNKSRQQRKLHPVPQHYIVEAGLPLSVACSRSGNQMGLFVSCQLRALAILHSERVPKTILDIVIKRKKEKTVVVQSIASHFTDTAYEMKCHDLVILLHIKEVPSLNVSWVLWFFVVFLVPPSK
jgi:hypothetical protein